MWFVKFWQELKVCLESNFLFKGNIKNLYAHIFLGRHILKYIVLHIFCGHLLQVTSIRKKFFYYKCIQNYFFVCITTLCFIPWEKEGNQQLKGLSILMSRCYTIRNIYYTFLVGNTFCYVSCIYRLKYHVKIKKPKILFLGIRRLQWYDSFHNFITQVISKVLFILSNFF